MPSRTKRPRVSNPPDPLTNHTINMKSLGGTMFFFGVGSAILYFLNVEFIFLLWIDLWGPTMEWIIRGVLAVLGGVLWLMGNQAEAAGD